jgi:hypothetical protein
VLVTPLGAGVEVTDAERAGLLAVRVVEVSGAEDLPRARCAGIRASSAPVVVLGENHSYPHTGWARALIDAHRGPWAVVGVSVTNANPDGAISWSNLFMDYGPWVEAATSGPVDDLPGHNSSFKRDVLLEYGNGLEAALRAHPLIGQDLRRRGHDLYLEATARTAHLNVTEPSAWLRERFAGGRFFAGLRSADWPFTRRLAYALGSPLIPPIRCYRIVRQIRHCGLSGQLLPRILPALAVGTTVSAAGELVACLFGRGRDEDLYEFELGKSGYVRPTERGGPSAAKRAAAI